jgi:type VI secretion system secreted protein VgrG
VLQGIVDAKDFVMNIDVMSASYIQAERIIRVETSLGPDVLLPERLSMHEKVSGLFELTVAVNSKRSDIAADELVGKLADVSMDTGLGDRRTWNGLVTDLIEGPGVTRGLRAYTLVLRPEHWLLSQRSDCRIWLDKTSVEIAQILMGEHGLASPVTGGIITQPPAQHYSVQFNETDLDYLTRRLEEDGIFFWFEHEGGSPGSVSAKHTLHLASDISGYVRGPETDVRFAMGSSDRNHVTKFEKRFRYLPGRRAGADWNFETPNRVPGGDTPSLIKLPKNDGYELYEYPSLAGYGSGTRASEGIDNDSVERQSKLRMMSSEADHQRSEGASTVRTLSPGRRFKPYDVANPTNLFDEQVIADIFHTAHDRSYATNEEGDPEYQNTFTSIPSKVPATPHRLTPRPKIEGTQVALVAGPEGEEIHPDEYGRIKVWFPWDRRAKKDGSDTCWIRVAQNWAGAGWGGQVIPRIGMEVMVTHLDGDPDRPLVTGVVPNAKQKVPYKLPDNKTRSIFRSNSHKSTGFNEMTFEDQTGTENMFFHAQKDQTTRVLNNRTARVDSHDVYSVGGSRAIEVAQNQKQEIGGSYNITVGGTGPTAPAALAGVAGLMGQTSQLLQQAADLAGGGGAGVGPFVMSLGSAALGFLSGGGLGAREGVVSGPNPRKDAGTDLAASGTGMGEDAGGMFQLPGVMNTVVQSFKSDSVGVARAEQIGVSKVTNVGQTFATNVGKAYALTIGETSSTKVGKAKKVEVGEKLETIVGKTNTIDVGETFEITAGKKFVITVGKTRIQMDSAGIITIEAPLTTIVKGGAAQLTVGPGPILYVPVLIPGKTPSPPAICLKRMAAGSTPFVRM